jgi:hypothetical protein
MAHGFVVDNHTLGGGDKTVTLRTLEEDEQTG